MSTSVPSVELLSLPTIHHQSFPTSPRFKDNISKIIQAQFKYISMNGFLIYNFSTTLSSLKLCVRTPVFGSSTRARKLLLESDSVTVSKLELTTKVTQWSKPSELSLEMKNPMSFSRLNSFKHLISETFSSTPPYRYLTNLRTFLTPLSLPVTTVMPLMPSTPLIWMSASFQLPKSIPPENIFWLLDAVLDDRSEELVFPHAQLSKSDVKSSVSLSRVKNINI